MNGPSGTSAPKHPDGHPGGKRKTCGHERRHNPRRPDHESDHGEDLKPVFRDHSYNCKSQFFHRVTPTRSVFALLSIISSTRSLGAAWLSRVVGSGPFTVK